MAKQIAFAALALPKFGSLLVGECSSFRKVIDEVKIFADAYIAVETLFGETT